MPEHIVPQPAAPDISKVDLTSPLPGDKGVERKIIVDKAYTQHVQADYARRENQEQQSIVDQTLTVQNQGAATPGSSSRPSAAAARRSQDQGAQMDQESSFIIKAGKRGRGKAEHLERISATLLPHLQGKKELADSAAAVVATAGQDTENGLLFSAADAQQLARDLSKVLQGRPDPFISVSTHEDVRKRIISSLSADLMESRGKLSEEHISDSIRRLNDYTIRSSDTEVSKEVAALAFTLRKITENSQDPVREVSQVVGNVRQGSEALADQMIAQFEFEAGRPLLSASLEPYPRDPALYNQKINEFCTGCIPEAHRSEYMRSFTHHIVRKQSESTELMQLRVTELARECRISVERLEGMKRNLVSLVDELQKVHGEQCCSPAEYTEILGLSTTAPNFATRFAALAEEPTAHARRKLEALSPGTQADTLSLALSTLIADLAAVEGVVADLAEASSEKSSLTLKIRESWVEFYTLYRTTLEEHGYLERARTRITSPHQEEIYSTPYAHAALTFALVPTESLLLAIAKASEAMSAFAAQAAKKEEPAEVREVADRARSITEDSAKRYVLAGDFGNADAMIAAYNSRFPDFPISTDVLSTLKASVTRQKNIEIAAVQENTAQKTV